MVDPMSTQIQRGGGGLPRRQTERVIHLAEYIYIPLQTVDAGANVLFNDTAVGGATTIYRRPGAGVVSLRGLTCQCRARFRVSFGGNIAIPADGVVEPISIALSIEGEALGAATAIYTPAAVEEFGNVFVAAFIDVPQGCCLTVAVRNTSDQPIDVQNANLIIERVA